ncbi:MAG: patatin-like phospholipase family protein, partial [Kiloniellales bacterium]|nr:patatin-like phospholipase family protein [Kiloniellales bacterium]
MPNDVADQRTRRLPRFLGRKASRPVRVLSIDGGGIRGILAAMVLAELERRADKPIADLFDFIAGTFTGGLVALGLTVPGEDGQPRYSARQVMKLYEVFGPKVF